jgi:hypothetical protein
MYAMRQLKRMPAREPQAGISTEDYSGSEFTEPLVQPLTARRYSASGGTSVKTNVFVRFFMPYFIVLSMSLIVFTFVYHATSRVVRSIVLSSGSQALESGRDLLDNRFQEMDRMIAHLNDEEEVRSFLQ